eukprot:gene5418-6914_t
MNALANEVLLPFDIQFEVTGIMTLSSGITIVHVKEVVPAPSTQGLSTGYPRLDFISPEEEHEGSVGGIYAPYGIRPVSDLIALETGTVRSE